MAIQVQFRRGTTSQNNAFTGAVGEITVDTTISTVRVHNGSTAGGTALVSADGAQTLTNKTLTSPTISGVGLISMTGNITGGNITASGNVTGGNITSAGIGNLNVVIVAANTTSTSTTTGALRVSGGAGIAGNVYSGGIGSFTGNVTGGNLTTAGVLTVNSNNAVSAIVNGGSNAVGNIGSSSGYFNTAFVKATSAQYADLAEMYQADANYEPGTVLSFGGEHDVTISLQDCDRRVAGVVSTDPAYIMNSVMDAPTAAAVALMGKVPTKVLGPVAKGDLMVSAGNGYARAESNPPMGSVIGKALEESQGGTGVINVVVGRL